jgi:hypothetical protein
MTPAGPYTPDFTRVFLISWQPQSQASLAISQQTNHLYLFLDSYGTLVVTCFVIVSHQPDRFALPSGYSLPTTSYPLSLFLSNSFPLSCAFQELNSFLFNRFRTLLSFFAFIENSTLLFPSNSELFAQNTRGVGAPPALLLCHSQIGTRPIHLQSLAGGPLSGVN